EDGLAEVERAMKLDPLSRAIAAALGGDLLNVGRYDEALARYRAALALDSTFALAHSGLCSVQLARHLPREAVAECELAVSLSGRYIGLGGLAAAYAGAGERPKAQAVLRELEDRWDRGYYPAYWIASVHRALGNRSGTLAWLERASAEREPWFTV